jgi:hypothetical protein
MDTVTLRSAPTDEFTKLDTVGITRVQEIIGVFLFYGRAIDSMMLVALGTITSQQANITQSTTNAITQLFNYATAHPYTNI